MMTNFSQNMFKINDTNCIKSETEPTTWCEKVTVVKHKEYSEHTRMLRCYTTVLSSTHF
jgi:hypothetical protein